MTRRNPASPTSRRSPNRTRSGTSDSVEGSSSLLRQNEVGLTPERLNEKGEEFGRALTKLVTTPSPPFPPPNLPPGKILSDREAIFLQERLSAKPEEGKKRRSRIVTDEDAGRLGAALSRRRAARNAANR